MFEGDFLNLVAMKIKEFIEDNGEAIDVYVYSWLEEPDLSLTCRGDMADNKIWKIIKKESDLYQSRNFPVNIILDKI